MEWRFLQRDSASRGAEEDTQGAEARGNLPCRVEVLKDLTDMMDALMDRWFDGWTEGA